ncbi:hypothetical protein BFJ68_g2377 [Fusarium oxysporum]|uniref:Uncharacterized protein n=1 Tax=Fusarium oxysporum TaxID=5507 RepID=A0A420RVM9_FUSOX|nr:hypothetical protein BFJ68_g2377 [Fusarium oxysporum]
MNQTNPEPPSDLLTDFVNAYREKIYFQPLPLFDPKRLQLKTGTLPQYLRWSFLALSLHYTSHNFYYGLEAKAIEYYTTSARSVVVDMAAEGLVKLEVMQALCLLALCDHIDAYEANVQDVGIVATCLGYISVWGSIISYLRDIRNGANEYPWLATSRHNQLTVKLYELENITSHRHLIRNAPFPDQPPSELSENREYWAPWVLFQVLMHATQAILNNPFVQLVALRRAGRNFQPRSFLQNTVDQALFHAEWVSRLVRMCADRQFEVEILRTLNIKVKKKRQSPQDDESSSATIQFEPDMMWELLDPAMSGVDWASLCKAGGTYAATSATIKVATKFIHPINSDEDNAPMENVSHNLFDLEDIYGEPFLDHGLPGRHTYVTQQGYDAALVEAQIFNHTRQLREAGYNVRAVWRGPEIPGTEMSKHMKDVHWNVAGIGFGVRGSQISDVITLFEETLDIYREEAPDAKYVFNYNPLTFLWDTSRFAMERVLK